ncbi:MAG: ASKHA domain-containing protein [Clostridia bacterium]|nr:ASKHA domain-containing protein [Clostridia bacterium]
MAVVKFFPSGKSIQVIEGTTILEAARQAGLIIESPCNCAGICGKCKVKLDSASLKNVVQHNKYHVSVEEAAQGVVLSCETAVAGDISVEIISKQQNKSLKILSHGKSFNFELDSFIKKKYSQNEDITYIFAGEHTRGTENGNTERDNYGMVVDIGTTTLVASLVDISTGTELQSVSALNPQAVHAQDVLSRIKFASEENGLDTMYSSIISEINGMIDELSKTNAVAKSSIYEVIFSGNTCMLHLAANVSPHSLGKYPYTPEVYGGIHLSAAEHKLDISQLGIIYLPPIISAYVGADITSGVLASQLHKKEGKTLFVDIGTNGEMVIGFDGKLSATSTAAGPAFEGMNITHGMRAGKGAVELFNVERDGSITVKTIGDIKPIGICGSGLLDIVGELVAYGVINKNGKFVEPEAEGILPSLRERLVKIEGKTVFMVSDGVYLSQKDVRQVQLAKGAVRAGIEFLLQSKGVKAIEIDNVLIAGSFGYHLRAKSLINIGLLPAEFEGRIDFIGNTSKSGGHAFLLNSSYRGEMESEVKKIDVLELANYKDFDKVFVKCLGF